MMPILIAAAAGFVAGSIPFGFLLVRVAAGRDVRQVGSGNIGATNVGRVLGIRGWVATLLADAAKGALPAYGSMLAWPQMAAPAAAAALGAILGHCYTPWLAGRGGKGVATMLGAFAVLAPKAMLLAVGSFALVALLTRFASLASLVASVTLASGTWWLGEPSATVWAASFTCALVVLRHRANLRRLLDGTEAKMGRSR